MADEPSVPTSVNEARERLAIAKDKKRKIEYQLAVRKRDGDADTRWRQRALFSRLCAEQEIAICRRYLAATHGTAAVPRPEA